MLRKNLSFYSLLLLILLFSSCTKAPLLLFQPNTVPAKSTFTENVFDVTQTQSQITTHPEADINPSISPDGKWIAFSSKRSGNMDIWVKPISGGSAVQLTTHRADDISPTWAPNSKKLAFVSFRDDALGDIWEVSLVKGQNQFYTRGKPKKITVHLGVDTSPVYSPEGKYIAFSSDRDGKQNIYFYQVRTKKFVQITQTGGIQPTWSPIGRRIGFIAFHKNAPSNGQLFYANLSFDKKLPRVRSIVPVTTGNTIDAFPCWNPLKNEIFFTRYDQDTDGDGKVTVNDQPGLWKVILHNIDNNKKSNNNYKKLEASGAKKQNISHEEDRSLYFQEMRLTPNLFYNYYPVCGKDSTVYFISRRKGNDDIWSIKTEGPIPRRNSAFFQYNFALTYFPLQSPDLVFDSGPENLSYSELQYRLLAFSRVLDFFPSTDIWSGWALYETAKTYAASGKIRLARNYFLEVLDQFQNFKEISLRTELSLFQLNYQNSQHKIANHIDQLNNIINQATFFPDIQAEAQLYIAEVLFLNKKYSAALIELEKLINTYRDQTDFCAKAQLLIGDTYSLFGQTEEVINSYLKVIQNYPQNESRVNLALDKILTIKKSPDFYDTISSYRNLISKYGECRRLGARTQIRIGELFFQRNDLDAAAEELQLISEKYNDQKEEIAQAEIILAEIFKKKNDDARSISLLKNLIANFGNVQGGYYVVKAKEQLLKNLMDAGDRFRFAGEIQAAYSRYRSAAILSPHNIDANRRMISMMYALRKIDDAIFFYDNMLSQRPENEFYLYMLGLCYSYKATEKNDRTRNLNDFDLDLMKKSNRLIEEALSKNYRIIQAYLTLSYNYEFIETYLNFKAKQKKNIFVSFVNTVVTPVKSAFYWLTFQREKKPEQWYEKAIDALTTAISLNDENENPLLESELAQNLASNYYNLQEFGFERAYYYYHIKLKHDSTFVNKRAEAEIYRKMGHCALVVEDFENGPKYLSRAIELSKELGDEVHWIINVKRLALLYQLAGEYDLSIEKFKIAADYELENKYYSPLEIDYRSIAYNFQLLNDEEEAIRYSQKALDLITKNKVKKVSPKPNWIKIGILGVEFPVWNLGQIGAGASTAAGGFTTEEEKALIYSILGQSSLGLRSIKDAISFLEKKLEIYRVKKDRIAEAIFLNNIGFLFYLDNDYLTAWTYYEKSLKICQKEENLPGTLMNILNLGSLGTLITKTTALENSFPIDHEVVHKFNKKSRQYLHNALLLFEDNEHGFYREQVQIYNLLGNLHSLSLPESADSSESDNEKIVNQQYQLFQSWEIADSCYNVALRLSQGEKLPIERLVSFLNIGTLSRRFGDYQDGLNNLFNARKIALQNDLSSWLWKIDFSIGDLLNVTENLGIALTSTKKADYYLMEAINTLEQNAHQLKVFRPTRFYHHQVRQLYQTAIKNSILNGNHLTALRLTEQYRGRLYLDILGSHKIQLKKERHKIFLGNARFLKNEVAELEKKIRNTDEDEKENNQEYSLWIKQKKNYENEYLELLEELKSEDPDLESFIHSEPITYKQLQEVLADNAVIVNYFSVGSHLYIWTISSHAVNYFNVEINETKLIQLADNFKKSIRENNITSISGKELFSILIAPVTHITNNFKTIIFIPDKNLHDFPFNFLVNILNNDIKELKNITVAPSLSAYYYSHQKRKIKETELFTLSPTMDSLFYNLGYDIKGIDDTSTMDSDKNIANNIQESKLLYLEAMLDQNQNDPLLTSIAANTFKKSTHLQIKDLYSFNLNSSSLALQTENKVDARVLQTLERALIYAGCPSLVISNGTENNHVSFWEYFFENLLDYPAAEALTRAQKSMRDAGFKPASYAFYQVVGFEGMTESQENQFARDRFRTMVALGNRYYEQKKWEDALNSYEQAVVMAARQGDQNAIENLYELILYSAANGGLWGKAINYQLKIVQQAIENRDAQKLIEEYRYLIYFYTQNKNYEKAIQYQKEYLDLTEKYNLTDETADSYHRLGLVLEQSGEFRQAADQFSRAINEYRELGDSLKVAECLKDRGRIYLLTLDNYSGAITDQHAALKIFQEFGNIEKSLEVLQNLGLSHERLANYQEALKLQMQGIELANTINSPTWIALSKQHLANVNWKTGNYQQALKFQKEALETFKKLNNLKFQEIGLSTYGLILFSLGQIEKGLEYEQEALVLAKRIQDYQDIATVHKNISLIYRSTGQWENALEHIKLAIDMDNKVGSERGLSYDFRDLGIIYRHQGKTGEAFNNFRLGLALSKKIKDGRNLAQSYYEIGKTHFSQNNLSSASDSLKLAINLAEDLFVPEVKWRALRILGQIYVEQNEYENALHPFLTALETIEKMRSRIKIEEYKSGFIDDKLEIYHDLINVYLKLKMPDKALEIVERAKSRNFVDLLANKNIKFSGDFSQQDFSKSKNIRGKINRVQNEISRLIIKGEEATDAENQMLEQLRQELSILKNQYQDLLLKLKEQNPELASMVTVEAKSIDYFQSALPDSVILLEYFYTKNQLFLWAVSNKSVTAKQEFISSDYLYSMVDTLRKSMVKQLPLKKIATELYQVLINPVQSEIEAFNHIVLIPHGILHYLPFASLINDNNKYLIENFSLSIASSATVFRLCLDKGEDFVNNDSWEPNILALGNPNLGNPEMELPFAEKEIESLQLTYSKVQSHLYNEASESRIKKAAADANLLLFSCHGEFDAVNPLFSALLLKSDEQNDGRLEAHEIFNLELKTYLVAMSACETGLAKIGVGDEVVGLSRSFIYAGSSSLLSSLWKVDDLATAVLVKRFFRYLKQGNSRAKALQRAVLFVKNNVNEHPLFWAAFNITGDFR